METKWERCEQRPLFHILCTSLMTETSNESGSLIVYTFLWSVSVAVYLRDFNLNSEQGHKITCGHGVCLKKKLKS